MSFEEAILSVPMPSPTAEEGGRFWRMEDPVLNESRVLQRGGMWEHQRTWWNMPNFIKVLVGGYGAGKTNILCKRAISLALTNAPCPVALVSPTFPIARQTTILTLTDMLEGKRSLLGRAFRWTYNKSTHQFTIRYNGRKALIIIYSGDKPLSLRGPNLAAAGIDEPFIQDYEVFKQMIARVRHPEAVHKEICITGTPEQLNWGYDLCVGEDREKHDVAFVQASTRKNLALDPVYVARLGGAYAGKEADAYIDGAFRNLSAGAVYYAFDLIGNVQKIKAPEYATWGAGMDFNVNPMAFTVFWRANDHIHFVKDYELPNSDTEDACIKLTEDFPQVRTIYPDPSGKSRHTNAPGGQSDFSYIRRAGYDIEAPPDVYPRRDRFNAANGKLKNRDGKVTCTIDPDCKKLIKYLGLHTYELANKQEHMTHLLDAFSYPIVRQFPVIRNTLSMTKISGV